MIRYSSNGGAQNIEEICEHCGEVIKSLHVSEITVMNEHDTRAIRILGKDGKTYQDVKSKEKFIAAKTSSYIREGLLDNSEAIEFRTSKKLKWGVRPEAMCSQSIDSVAGVTASFCYKTTNSKFKAKTLGSKTFEAIFTAATEKESTELGKKVGLDRKGNIIRMKSEKNLDQEDKDLKYHGQFKESWFRELASNLQKSYLETAQGCKTLLKDFGEEELESGKVMSRFKDLRAFKTYIDRNCGR